MGDLVAYIHGLVPVSDEETKQWLDFLEKPGASPKMQQLADVLRRLWTQNRDQAAALQWAVEIAKEQSKAQKQSKLL